MVLSFANRLLCVLIVGFVLGCGTGSPKAQRASPTASPTLGGAVALAQRLATIERDLRSPATPANRLRSLGEEQQEAYRAAAAHADWQPQLLAAVPPAIRTPVQANLQASAELQALNSKPPSHLPHWHIVAPEPGSALLSYYDEGQRRYGVPWAYLAAINLVETHMGRIRGDSVAGAKGPMQFMPATWSAYGHGDVDNPRDSILAAARYLRAAGAPQDMAGALYAYNHSRHYVRAITLYAQVMLADRRAYFGYYYWQVYLLTRNGVVRLREGDTT